MISFIYTGGINRFDTPYFPNKTAQKKWFDVRIISQMDDSFYPVRAENLLQVSTDDLTYDTQVDYVRLTYNDKDYYYFIDDVRYINEYVMELSLNMDVIQTYMFNIKFNSSSINRRLINRWDKINNNEFEINRKYLRENLSKGIFERYKYNEDVSQMGFLCIKIAPKRDGFFKTINTTRLFYPSLKPLSMDENFLSEDSLIFLLPCVDGVNTGITKDITIKYIANNVDNPVTYICSYNDTLFELATNPDVSSITYIPFNNISRDYLRYVKDGPNEYTFYYYSDKNTGLEVVDISDTGKLTNVLAVHMADINVSSSVTGFDFYRNENEKEPWDYRFIPQLLDENYIQIYYGDRMMQTSYPTSKMKRPLIYCNKSVDLFSGNRNYWLTEINNSDEYLTLITNDSKELMTQWTDAWKQYQATHWGTLGLGTAYNLGKSAFNVKSILGNPKSYTPKRHQLSAKAGRGIRSDIISETDELMNVTENYINLQFTPKTLNQGNTYTNDIFNNSLTEIYYEDRVTDLEDCGRILEGTGYSVHQQYGNENIIDLVMQNDRTYFNILGCEDVHLTLDVICDDATIQAIEQRLINGLRLWNIDKSDANLWNPFLFDNVEIGGY